MFLVRGLRRCSTVATPAASTATPAPPTPSRFKIRYVFAVAIPVGAYTYWSVQIRNRAIEEAKEGLVSSEVPDTRELLKRACLPLEATARIAEDLSGKGYWVSPDEVGVIVSRHSPDRKMDTWDILSLLRFAPTNRQGRVEVREVLVAVTSILNEEVDGRGRVTSAWNALFGDKDACSRDELVELLSRMERTGHMESISLSTRINWAPPAYAVYDGIGLASLVVEAIPDSTEDSPITLEALLTVLENEKFRKKKFNVWYFDDKRLKLNK